MHVYVGADSGEKTLARVASGPRNSMQREWGAAITLGSNSMGVQNQGMVMEPNTGAMPTR